jgi:hypothetical protein
MATPTNLPASFVSGAILTAAQQNDLRGAFRVLQVIYSTTATFTTFGDTTYADSNLTATITPQSTTSKILVLAFNNGCVRGSEDSGNELNLRIVRGATQILEVLGFGATGTALLQLGTVPMQVLDSPASTSALTYKVQGKNSRVGSTVGVQYQSTTSTLVLMEISA